MVFAWGEWGRAFKVQSEGSERIPPTSLPSEALPWLVVFRDDLKAAFVRASPLRDNGDLAGARAILERLGDEHPQEFGVWLVLGGVQMSQSDYVAAEMSLSVAVAMHPRSELASLSMFHTLKHLGPLNDAFGEMRRFLALGTGGRGQVFKVQGTIFS